MGKISDALERHKKEKGVKDEDTPPVFHSTTPSGAEEKTAKSLGPLPGYDHRMVVLSDPSSLEAEHFKMLRAQILFPKEGKVPKTIMITSSYPGEGKTYISANLAVSIALGINEHVLLIDCDLRNPSIHKFLGYSNNQGLHEYLTGEKPLTDLIIRSGIDKLSLLCAGGPSRRAAELLSSAKMKEFLTEVRDRYPDRFIIIDSTPTQVTAEPNVLSNLVDGIVFVVLAERAPRASVRKSIELVGRDKTLGVVFNGYDESVKFHRRYCAQY
jgi:exopolysaccharide/PEP-CTERM locus tyrosine autokinase